MVIYHFQGKEQSRRDDLLAIGHMFYYFLSGGNLPWQGVKSSNVKKRYQLIGQIKEDTKLATLGYGHPREFETYTRQVTNLINFEKYIFAILYLGLDIVIRYILNISDIAGG